jgi:VIT1/CCC1 family predicted Fe2+/Mn2+ transporter
MATPAEATADDAPVPLSASRLNSLRAAVLGANDGIVSVAAAVLGVVGATRNNQSILIAAVAVLVAGAMSMAAGEYVSVSSQRDAEIFARDCARANGATDDEITAIELTSPHAAALASFVSFMAGGLIPTLVVLAPWWGDRRDVATFVAVIVALVITGWLSARFSNAPIAPAIRRVVLGGTLAMAVTFGIGTLVGAAV